MILIRVTETECLLQHIPGHGEKPATVLTSGRWGRYVSSVMEKTLSTDNYLQITQLMQARPSG